MSKKHTVKPDNKKIKPKYTATQALTNYYLIIMFTLFPLFFTNKFYNIRHDKCYFFIIFTAFLLVAVLLLGLSENTEASKNESTSSDNAFTKFIKSFSFTDWAVIAFLAVCIISTLLSDYPMSAFFGESDVVRSSGRNSGLLLIIFYVIAYFLITRYFHYFEYIFTAFAVGSAIVFLLAIFNSYYYDPLNMLEGLSEKNSMNFFSTIGNKNMLSSFICIALPVAVTMSVHTKKNALRAVYYTVSGLGFAALMAADSDSGILGMTAFLAIYLVWYSRRIDRVKFYFLNVFIMLLSAKLLWLISSIFNLKNKGMDAYQEFFVSSNASLVLLIAVGIITILLFVLDFKRPNVILPKAVPIAIASILGLAVISLLSVVAYFSIFDTTTKLGGLETILRFNDKWGTHRGFMWIRSMWIFGDFSFIEKLFGSGPDTFFFPFKPYFGELLNFGDSSTNAAHNEYINYLITTGILGLASYLAIVGSAIASAVKYSKQNPLAIVCASTVICYSVQAVVNISQPITTPLFIIFIALCESVARTERKKIEK